ncbi:MAG: SH3 domain-containing protein [Ectobacillus sp.]
MKKVLASIAAVSVAGGTAAGTVQAAPDQAQQATQTSEAAVQNETQAASYSVNADALRVRTGPGTSHGILGLVKQGQTLQVIGEVDGWYKIQFNGSTAYVSKEFVNATTTQVQATGGYTVDVSSLRVRTGPSTSHGIIGTVHKGQAVKVIGEVQDWYKIDYNGRTAYVSKDYISHGNPETPAPALSAAPVRQDGTYVVDVSSLRVRTGPGTYYPVIGGVLQGQALKVTGVSGDWYKIDRNGTTGYVSAQYVKFVQGDAAPAAPVQDYYVNVSALNVRSGAGTQHGVIGVVTHGQKVQVSGEESGWSKINYNGKIGYVATQFLSKTLVAPATQQAEQPSQQAAASSNMAALISYAKSLAGVPYVWGGTTPRGFDCSGYIYHVYSKFGYSFGRTSVAGYWNSLAKTSNPQPGDLIFFQNTYKPGPSHVGVYLGNGSFIQAGDNGVAIASLSSSYWKNHFLGYAKPY